MNKEPSTSAIALTALMMLKGIGRRGALRIMAEANVELGDEECKEFILTRGATPQISTSEFKDAWKKATERLDESAEAGISALSFFDKKYPSRLSDTPDPPAVLFARGNIGSLESDGAVAIVGTREPTEFGVEVALRSGRSAVHAGFTVVSGLAHGCDAYGHKGCVEANGVGVAVLAHGLDKIYPAANRDLAERLLDCGGCWVSEYLIGSSPVRSAFAERDRIQSGLSDGVLVIETDVKGGTMHTVNFSRQQQRPLGCILHPARWLSEDKTKGNQKLISNGWAIPIADSEALSRFLLQIRQNRLNKTDVTASTAAPVAGVTGPIRDKEAEAEQIEETPAQISMRF